MHALIDAAYDEALLEGGLVADSSSEGVLLGRQLRAWAQRVLAPASPEEDAAFNELFTRFAARQGYGPERPLPRPLLHQHRALSWLKDALPHMERVRAAARAARRESNLAQIARDHPAGGEREGREAEL